MGQGRAGYWRRPASARKRGAAQLSYSLIGEEKRVLFKTDGTRGRVVVEFMGTDHRHAHSHGPSIDNGMELGPDWIDPVAAMPESQLVSQGVLTPVLLHSSFLSRWQHCWLIQFVRRVTHKGYPSLQLSAEDIMDDFVRSLFST